VSNRILLFSQSPHEGFLKLYEGILKAVFRKFRKTVIFSRLPYVSVQEKKAYRIVKEEIERCDGILGACGDLSEECASAVLEASKPYAKFHCCGRKAVISPVMGEEEKKEDRCVYAIKSLEYKNAENTVKAMIKSLKRKDATVVTDSGESPVNKMISSIAEEICLKTADIKLQKMSMEEIMWQCKNIESFPDVFITGENERAATAFMCSLRPSLGGYIRYEGEKKSLYTAEKLPFSEITGSAALSAAMACAAMLENELEMQSAAEWLRRAAAISWEKCENPGEEAFLNEIITHINEKMRNRKN